MNIETLLIKGIDARENPYKSVVPPIHLSTTFVQESLETHGTFEYTRGGNPTRNNLEKLFSKIEEVNFSFAFSSGMAASSSVFHLFKSGDKILFNNNIYGGTYRYANKLFKKQGLTYELIDDFNTIDENSLTDDVAAIFIETPSNPLLRVIDIERLTSIAHKKNILVIVDNTFMTSYLQNPFKFGVDIVVYSATKYLSGHADVLAGLVSTNSEEIATELKLIQNTLGSVLSPTDSYNIIRGIKTLSVRIDRQQENTCKIISFFEKHPAIERIFYAGNYSELEYNIQKKQSAGIGAVISICLKNDYDTNKFVQNLNLFDLAVSLGGVESLICHPASMTHESYDVTLLDQIGITNDLLRLAIGIENSDDLINDLDQALNSSKKQS